MVPTAAQRRDAASYDCLPPWRSMGQPASRAQPLLHCTTHIPSSRCCHHCCRRKLLPPAASSRVLRSPLPGRGCAPFQSDTASAASGNVHRPGPRPGSRPVRLQQLKVVQRRPAARVYPSIHPSVIPPTATHTRRCHPGFMPFAAWAGRRRVTRPTSCVRPAVGPCRTHSHPRLAFLMLLLLLLLAKRAEQQTPAGRTPVQRCHPPRPACAILRPARPVPSAGSPFPPGRLGQGGEVGLIHGQRRWPAGRATAG